MKYALALTLALALVLPCPRAEAWPLSKQAQIGVASVATACVLVLGIWGISKMVQRGIPPDAVAQAEAEAAKMPVDEFVAKASDREARRQGVAAQAAERQYLVQEGRLYSTAPGEPVRLERDPSGDGVIRKVVAAGTIVVVLCEDGSARELQNGGAWKRIAENVTDVSAENGALWVSVSNQRLRYEDGLLLADD